MALVIGLAVLLVGVPATWAGFSLLGDNGGAPDEPPPPEEPEPAQLVGEMGWELEPGSPGSAPAQLGAWVTDDLTIAATAAGVIAFDRETGPDAEGDPVWALQPPELDSWPTATEDPEICGASTTSHDGMAAVTYGATVPEGEDDEISGSVTVCPGLALVDLETGEPVWTTDMFSEEDGSLGSATRPHPEMVEDTVAVTFTNEFRAFDRADGSDKWRAYARDADREYCMASDLQVHGDQFIAVANCYNSYAGREDPEPLKVMRIDPDSGDDEQIGVSVEEIGVAPGMVTIVSPEPPYVLHVNADDVDEEERYLVVGESEEQEATTVLAEQEGLSTTVVGPIGYRSEFRVLVTDDLLVTVTAIEDEANTGSLVAYELASGEQAWEAPPPDGMDGVFPVATSDGRIIAAATHEGEETAAPIALYEVNPSDGSLEVLADGYDGNGIKVAVRDSTFVWHLGRVYVFNHFGSAGLPEIYALH